MRIIGGELSGRRIEAPAGADTRPTSDRVREAIFNRLAHGGLSAPDGELIEPFTTATLDLYAGSGALGLEALSRGATRCDFVDQAPPACATVKKNAEALGLDARAKIHLSPVEKFLKRATQRYGLVFVDPPYADAGSRLDRALAHLVGSGVLLPGALVIVEHGDKPAPGEQAGLPLLDQRRYGQTVISFFWSPQSRGIGLPA